MVKKTLLISLLTMLWGSQAAAITIVNENSMTIHYTIGDRFSCKSILYNEGDISSHGAIIWIKNSFFHPENVCILAKGYSSVFGVIAYNIKNDSCIVKIIDAGFMKGIKLELVSGC